MEPKSMLIDSRSEINGFKTALGTFVSTLGAFGSIAEHLHGAQSSVWHTVPPKSMFLGKPLALWKHRGVYTSTPKLISADTSSDIDGLKGPRVASGMPQT